MIGRRDEFDDDEGEGEGEGEEDCDDVVLNMLILLCLLLFEKEEVLVRSKIDLHMRHMSGMCAFLVFV